jgi:N-methylhydantoinase A
MDAGGTMTDTIVVDEFGNFTVGKALTTPHDESVGFFGSLDNALSSWDVTEASVFPHLKLGIYAGTTMLNTLLQRRGARVGLITTKGFEDDVLMGRGIHVWKSYAYSDRPCGHARPPSRWFRRRHGLPSESTIGRNLSAYEQR